MNPVTTRRHRTLAVGLLSSALVLSGCSGDGAGKKSSPTSDGSSSAQGGAAGPHGPVPAPGAVTPAVLKALGRSTVPAAEMAKGRQGTWKGTKVGVLAQGKDATLVVQEKGQWRVVGGWWPSKGMPGPYLGGRQHVLLLGSDARKGQSVTRSRGDSIQLFGTDGRGGGGVLGFPRDSYVPLATGGTGKLNGAMAKGGPGAMVRTVSRTSGIPVKGYLLTSFDGFVRGVHAIGGIPVHLKRPIKDVPAGHRTLTGMQAITVARERKSLPGGDFDRSNNQGMLLMGALVQLRSRGIADLPHLMQVQSPHIVTDLAPRDVLTTLAAAYALSPTRVGQAVAKGVPGSAGGASIVRLTPAARTQFAKFRDGNL